VSAQKVLDVMTAMPVQVEAATPVNEVAKLMREQDIGAVLITDSGRVTGVVTDRDLVVRMLADDKGPESPVAAACSRELFSLRPEDDVDVAVEKMSSNAVRRLPVVDDSGQAVGIVSLGDLALLRDRDSALGKISAAEPTS